MYEHIYSVLSMHTDRQAITPLGDRGGTMGGWESRPRIHRRFLLKILSLLNIEISLAHTIALMSSRHTFVHACILYVPWMPNALTCILQCEHAKHTVSHTYSNLCEITSRTRQSLAIIVQFRTTTQKLWPNCKYYDPMKSSIRHNYISGTRVHPVLPVSPASHHRYTYKHCNDITETAHN